LASNRSACIQIVAKVAGSASEVAGAILITACAIISTIGTSNTGTTNSGPIGRIAAKADSPCYRTVTGDLCTVGALCIKIGARIACLSTRVGIVWVGTVRTGNIVGCCEVLITVKAISYSNIA
jgi:hypothetical protein